MFVLRNSWAALGRHKVRAVLMCLVALLVTVGSIYGCTVIHQKDYAEHQGYDALTPAAVIRPTPATLKDRSASDSAWTKHYLSWEDYNKIYQATASKDSQIGYTIAESVPVRQSDSVKAITTADADTNENKTGGNLTLQSFYTDQAMDANEYGTIKVVEGKDLNFESNGETSVLVSRELANKNGLKVGSEITLGNPQKASETFKVKVSGIYEYTDAAPTGFGADAKAAKDNRDNVLYCTYFTFATNGLDTTDGKGWGIPDLNIVFTTPNPAGYDTFVKELRKAKVVPDGYLISSPTIIKYEKSIAPLVASSRNMLIMLVLVWSIGGLLLLIMVLMGSCPRRDEIGNALLLGVTKARLGWQFMLEVFYPLLIGWGLGLIIGGTTAHSACSALASYSMRTNGAVMWKVVWIGLGFTLLMAIIAMLRVAFFNTNELFVSPFERDPLEHEHRHEFTAESEH